MTKRILILMSKTGGGHRASAEALKAGFAQLYGDDFEVEIIDLLMDYLPWPVRELPKSYSFLAGTTPWLWRLLFQATDEQITAATLNRMAARVLGQSIAQAFTRYQPDLVISVHPLVQYLSMRALKVMRLRIPFVTVVTDLATVHPAWFHPRADLCFIPSQEAYTAARKARLTPEQIRLYGLPIRPMFATPPQRGLELRARLQMDPDLPAALLVGGGEGIGKVASIAHALNARLFEDGKPLGQMVIICGSNRKLYDEMSARKWSIPVRVLGYVDNMAEWMAACDCIVTKAGPGTIAEALTCGLPIMLSGFIPGQEEGNVPYVINHQVGAYRPEPEDIARLVTRWFGPERGELARMAANARQLGNPRATFHIVEDIAGLLGDVPPSLTK
jgi:1,2-diacylglycerol 3-beta-galactosyltransferase